MISQYKYTYNLTKRTVVFDLVFFRPQRDDVLDRTIVCLPMQFIT